jgi:hypothetical protein
MHRLGQVMKVRWAGLGGPARLWWTGLGTVVLAAVLVLAATIASDASSHPAASSASASSRVSPSSKGSMTGMKTGPSGTGSSVPAGSAPTTSTTVCGNVKGATTMANGMVMAPVPSGNPTAFQEAAANQLVSETTATLAKYTSLSAATAAGYTPATNPDGYLVHYANWGIAKTDGFDPSSPAFLMYANTVDGPKLLGAMYLGPAPCTPGPDVGGPLTQWHAHDDLCLSDGQVVGKTSVSGTCAAGVHNTNTYFMLHVWTEPSLASTHQFQADLTRAELAPIIRGQA